MKKGKDSRVCIIGAGPSGITAAKHLIQVGLTNFVVYDKNDQVGGNWIYSPDPGHSSVYEAAHIISSKKLSQYHDFPMPKSYPDYPNHKLLLKYFQDYANHFGVTSYVQFNTEVKQALREKDETWTVILGDGSKEKFDFLIVANGHHWNPRIPKYPGKFAGEIMHSHFYKTHLPFKGKRVLIVGGGNSACDISVDICRHAEYTALSWRRGYYVIPKLMFGRPPDEVNAKINFLPRWLRKRLSKILWKILVGNNKKYGLQEPTHQITDTHPILNSKLLDSLRHGDITPKVEIERFDGNKVFFVDGSSEEFDTIVFGTGYKISFPFIDNDKLDFSGNTVPLYLKMFHPDYPTLAIIGLVQPQGCIWPLSDTQGQITANYIIGKYELPEDMDQRIQKEVNYNLKTYVNTPRHSTEVDYHRFLKILKKELPKNVASWKM